MNSGRMTQNQAYVRSSSDLFTVETGAEESYSFDLSACLVRAAWGGTMYRWGLDGSCLAKERQPFGMERKRRLLPPEEGLRVASDGYEQALRLIDKLRASGDRALQSGAWPGLLQVLSSDGLDSMRRRSAKFAQVYRPVGILPPDQYGALVLQLTEGCRYNRCTFCTFYRDISYRVKSPAEFVAHVQAVLEMLGAAINRRRTVFLGDANALGAPIDELYEAFDILGRLLPANAREGVYTFMDVFGRKQKTASEYARLVELGLRRIYVGVESGSVEVLRILRKPEELAVLRAAVQAMKTGGAGVGLIFLLGAGGRRLAEAHTRETAALLASLPLDARDIVYFSELVADPASEYAAWEKAEGIVPLSVAEMRQQAHLMRQGLTPVEKGGPRVTRYDVREFIYY